MQQSIVVLQCDLCGRAEGDGVNTHIVALDGRSVELEACAKCWAKPEKALAILLEKGRQVKLVTRQARQARGSRTDG